LSHRGTESTEKAMGKGRNALWGSPPEGGYKGWVRLRTQA